MVGTNGVEEGRLATHAVAADLSAGIQIGTTPQQQVHGIQLVVFDRHVQEGDTPQREMIAIVEPKAPRNQVGTAVEALLQLVEPSSVYIHRRSVLKGGPRCDKRFDAGAQMGGR